MPKQSDILDNHPFYSSLVSIEELTNKDGFFTHDILEEELFLEILKLQRIVFHIQQAVSQVSSSVFSLEALETMNQHNIDCIHELSLFQQSQNIDHIRNANTHIDNNIAVVEQNLPINLRDAL